MTRKRNAFSSYLIVGLWLLLMALYMNNAISASMVSTKYIQVALLAMCVWFFYKKIKLMPMIVVVGLLLSVFMCVSSVLVSPGRLGIGELISHFFLWSFLMTAMYYIARDQEIQNVVIGMSVLALAVFVWIYLSKLELISIGINRNQTITAVYYLLCMLPFMFHIRSKWFRYTAIILINLLTLVSFKRSAILVLGCVDFVLLFTGNASKKTRNNILISGAVIIAALIAAVLVARENSAVISDVFDVLMYRFNAGSDSRFSIYAEVVELQLRSDFFEWIFGHGYDAVLRATRVQLSAHNDYLEILYDFGLIGFGAFAWFVLLLIRQCFYFKRKNSPCAQGMIVSVVIFLVASLPSHMLTYSTYFMILAAYWGFALGIDARSRYQKNGESG